MLRNPGGKDLQNNSVTSTGAHPMNQLKSVEQPAARLSSKLEQLYTPLELQPVTGAKQFNQYKMPVTRFVLS